MRVIREAARERDFRHIHLRSQHHLGTLQPQLPPVCADRHAEETAELAREVHRMLSDLRRDAGKRQRIVCVFMDHIASRTKPGRRSRRDRMVLTHERGDELQSEAFNRDSCEGIVGLELRDQTS